MRIPFLLKERKYILIDTTDSQFKGKRVYDNLSCYEGGFAKAQINDDHFFIDYNEKRLSTKASYYEIKSFENGVAAVKVYNSFNGFKFINRNGVELSDFTYMQYLHKEKGFIQVTSAGMPYIDEDNEVFITEFFKGIIDNTGFEVIPPEKDIYISIEETFFIIHKKNEYQAIDFDGLLIRHLASFSYIGNFFKRRAFAVEVNTKDIWIIDDKFNKIKNLGTESDNGLRHRLYINASLIPIRNKNKWGCIDLNGELVWSYEFDQILIRNNYLIVGLYFDKSMKFSLFDNNRKPITEFKYDEIKSPSFGIATVRVEGLWGAIDNNGKEIIEPMFTKIGTCKNDLIWVSYGRHEDSPPGYYEGKYGFYDSKGKQLTSLLYDNVYERDEYCVSVEINEKWGLVNKYGQVVAEPKYDDINYISYPFYWVSLNGLDFVIDVDGAEYRSM